MELSSLEKRLLNDFQQDFPLTARPFLAIAERLSVTEQEVLVAMQLLTEKGLIQRIGSIIQPNKIGKSLLAAVAVPDENLEQVASIISQFPEVNHNYERENALNLWFVLMAEDEQHLQTVIADIEQQIGYRVLQFPLLQDFYINLGFDLDLTDG
jgi:DNA-binding Lrp family transcriptional regulator